MQPDGRIPKGGQGRFLHLQNLAWEEWISGDGLPPLSDTTGEQGRHWKANAQVTRDMILTYVWRGTYHVPGAESRKAGRRGMNLQVPGATEEERERRKEPQGVN